MKLDPQQLLETPVRDPEAAAARTRAWRWAGVLLLAVVVGQLALYGETLLSVVTLWNRSQTYTHGWIIGPISGYLIWLRRHELFALDPKPSLAGALLWAALNLMWLIGYLAGALVVTQYAVIAMVPVLVWALLGTQVAWAIAFPLFFLLLAVPSGEAMVPTLIDFTADFTVKMLQLTGIPVYREGTYFSVPSGDWNVVEACSGIRYLIASFTGGCLFAYLYYRSPWKRAAVILASLLIPIVANGFRAYMIVMIGHLSDMRLAVGVDHFIYGWVFFGVVMFALFWVASLWREADGFDVEADASAMAAGAPRLRNVVMMGAVLVLAGGLWRAYALHLDSVAANVKPIQLPAVAARSPWSEATTPVTQWEPRFRGFGSAMTQTFSSSDASVMLKVLYYREQSEGKELISSTNQVVGGSDGEWRVTGHQKLAELDGAIRLQETSIRKGQKHLLVWHWLVVDGTSFSNPFFGKWLLAKDRLLGSTGEGAAVFIATPYEGQPQMARASLRRFLADMNPGLQAALNQARER